jgi:hypothetical protein
MADDIEPDPAPVAETLPDDTLPAASAPDGPTPAELAQQDRDARIRAEAEARAYREAALARPEATPPAVEPVYTPTQIEAAFAANQIDAARKGREYERYTQSVAQHAAETARAEERAASRAEALNGRLQAHFDARPGLLADNSPEVRQVTQWIAERGGNPQDRAAQLMGCDALFGEKRGGIVDAREARRRATLGSGGGAPASGDTSGKPDPLKGIPADYLAYWKSHGANLSDPKVAQKYATRFWSTRPGQRARTGAA